MARAYRASDHLLRKRNLLTFGMQLLDAVRALEVDAEFTAQLRKRFRYILVDEFQDTNVAQIELLWRLAGGHRNIVAVGDHAQAIYRFRGASFGSFTTFLERFAGVPLREIAQPRRGIFNRWWTITARRVASCAPRDKSRDFWNSRRWWRRKSLSRTSKTAKRCASRSSLRMKTRLGGSRWRLNGCIAPGNVGARLRRCIAFIRHRDLLVEALEERGIPFVIRNLSILNHPLVRDLLAYVRLLVNRPDNIACARVLAAPAWGLEPADLLRLCERARQG